MTTRNAFYTFLLIAMPSLAFIGCEEPTTSDPDVIEELEGNITTLRYTLVPFRGDGIVVMSYRDLGGNGIEATIQGGKLAANETYACSLELLDENKSAAETINARIEDKDLEHQFFFSSTVDGLSVKYDDKDSVGNPIGLTTNLTTGDAASGDFTIILRHAPNKSAHGVSNGDISNAGGETEVEVTFEVEVI